MMWFLPCEQDMVLWPGSHGTGDGVVDPSMRKNIDERTMRWKEARDLVRAIPSLYLDHDDHENDKENSMSLRDAMLQLVQRRKRRVVLLIPEEGLPARVELLSLCERVLRVIHEPSISSDDQDEGTTGNGGAAKDDSSPGNIADAAAAPDGGTSHAATRSSDPHPSHHRGLPSQVASAIALHRLTEMILQQQQHRTK